jgi:hypothetical protein
LIIRIGPSILRIIAGTALQNYVSGAHWVNEIITMIVQGKADYTSECKEAAMLEFVRAESLEAMSSETPRVLNTHLYFRHLPRDLFEKGGKVVYMLRNPKDVTVSFYCHRKTAHKSKDGEGVTWADFLSDTISGRHREYEIIGCWCINSSI